MTKERLATTNTDQVNLQGSRFPVDGLASSIERGIEESCERKISFGYPTCVSHDLHRLLGWNIPIGIHLSGDIARQIALMILAENEEDLRPFQKAHIARLNALLSKAAAQSLHTLRERVGGESEGARVIYVNGTVGLNKDGLARSLYPEFFITSSPDVDKDGLVSVSALEKKWRMVFPGVFHDPKRDLFVFAHPYFRRSLSSINSLNEYFLGALVAAHTKTTNLDVRIKLDPDTVAFPTSKGVIELEYWWGPKFSDDISKIPSGVSEHQASESNRLYEGLERTQFWWKNPETRENDVLRTFEAEELLLESSPSLGLSHDDFGCRYVHSEYSSSSEAITHFDGAIRAYARDAYVQRRSHPISTAGKHAAYTKLFRIDGPLPIGTWQSLCCAFFKGNDLLPEYFGAEMSEKRPQQNEVRSERPSDLEALVGYISSDQLVIPAEANLVNFGDWIKIANNNLLPFDLLPGQCDKMFMQFEEYRNSVCADYSDGKINFPTIALAAEENSQKKFDELCISAANAIAADGIDARITISFLWNLNDYWVGLSFSGQSMLVADALRRLSGVVKVASPPSEWIEKLKSIVRGQSAVDVTTDVAMQNINSTGLLQLEHRLGSGSLGNIRVPPTHPLFRALAES